METGQMQEEQHSTHQFPFNPGVFIPDSGRRATLEALRDAVKGSASLITCIGEEGHGKTMLCKILEKDFPEPYLVISFPYSVESFDHVLQIIALKLNLDFSMEDNALGSGHILKEIAQTLREQGQRILLLFDEAEKLYLATLERIRKMIDLINKDGVLLQIILFGRIGLQAHIEQLALCTFKNTQEVHLSLPSLTEEDTFQYLNFCMRQHPGSEKKDIFSREVAAQILAMSLGNFRKINSLAANSLRSSSYNADNTSFMVLIEHVRDADDLLPGEPPAPRLPFLSMQKKIALGSGVLVMAMVLFLFVSREAKKSDPTSAPQGAQIIMRAKTQQVIPDKKDTTTQSVQPAPRVVAEPVTQPVQPTPATVEAPVVKLAQPALAAAEDLIVKEISVKVAPLIEIKSSAVQLIVADKFPKKNTIIQFVTHEPVTKNNELLTVRKEARKSFSAGERWLAGEKNDHFTLQIMVLAADQAGEKLQRILRDEANQKRSEKFIVLKKSTSPATFILFYGEFPTLAAARNARNDVPQSLQRYTPYPVAIKEAVKKSNL
jgi:type II secretory pathway predicted ATPase ExeA/septal ring-binding cell division protein DamX